MSTRTYRERAKAARAATRPAPTCIACGFRRAEPRVVLVAGRFEVTPARFCASCAGRAVADEPVDESDVVADSAT